MNRSLILAPMMLVLASGAIGQVKPVSRSEFVKSVDNRFAEIDSNHNGIVDKAELTARAARELQIAKARMGQQLQAKFKQLDTNKDGQLSLPEFMAAAPPIRTTETPDQLLQRLDGNHDGKVSADEFRAPEMAKFNRVDANHDGIATPQEQAAAAGK